jgi:solute carrier family 35, member F1/2
MPLSFASPDANIGKDGVHMPRWKILVFGQVLSVLLSVMWASQATLYLKCQWTSPAFSCGWAYFLLSLNIIPLICKGRSIRKGIEPSTSAKSWFLGIIPLDASPWIYFGMAILSFYGNYCYLLAISLTTVTSISLVDAISVPTAMILSHYFLKRQYLKLHYVGAALCLTGVTLGVVVDLIANRIHQDSSYTDYYEAADGSEEYPNKVLGDVFAGVGAVLFGTNDVLTEYSVHRFGGTTEYLAMMGFFGTLISLFQVTISERQTVANMFNGVNPGGCSGSVIAGLLVAYVFAQFSRKTGLASFLTMSDAAMLQLSLLTSDLYTALFSIIYQHILPRPSSWVAMVIVMSGIVVYEMSPSPEPPELKMPIGESHENGTSHDGIFRVDGQAEDQSSNLTEGGPSQQVV